MSPFVQELVSFISILAGVVILTSWVMWILLRPSGDSKVKDFAQESAKDGLTRCVMENNELKNTIKRLERENKVLMSAGYGHKPDTPVAQVEEERIEAKDEGEELVEREREEQEKGERLKVKEEVLKAQETADLLDAGSVEVDEVESVAVEPLAPKRIEPAPEPTTNKITDEAEKKKIADYMASVEKETERQKEEIKKVESWKKSGPYSDDDLKKIRGIGPHIEKMLKKAGITSYKQIAAFNGEDIRLVSDAIGSFPRRINREQWVEQARALVRKG